MQLQKIFTHGVLYKRAQNTSLLLIDAYNTLVTINRSLQLTAAMAKGVASISVEPNPH